MYITAVRRDLGHEYFNTGQGQVVLVDRQCDDVVAGGGKGLGLVIVKDFVEEVNNS